MNDLYIHYYKWNDLNKKFFQSCKEYLNVIKPNFYNPIYSLYFYIHNTKNARKTIDIDRRYYLQNITNSTDIDYSNSNMFLTGTVHDSVLNKSEHINCFAKCMPILDPIHLMMNNYTLSTTNILQPSNYIHNTIHKINDLNNSCYIDTFFSYIASNLTENNILPSFPLYYGSINSISNNFKYDISEEYYDIINEKWFSKYIGKLFKIDMYISDSENDSDNESIHSVTDQIICIFEKMPVQYLFIEQLEGTLEDLLNDNINILISCLFQIIYTLCYLQKHFKFTHNDLHINNIMYSKTEKLYLYYKYNNIYFKVPTYGYIFKLIDFGRSIFTFKKRVFNNDSFSKYGEAEGQYDYPIPPINSYIKNKYKLDRQPNYSFDMCRLATTIIDELEDNDTDVYKFLIDIVTDKDGNNIYETMSDDFDLYIEIAEKSCNGLPYKLLLNNLFNKFRIKKKYYPKIGGYRINF